MKLRIARLSFSLISLVSFISICFAVAVCQDAPPPRPLPPLPPGTATTEMHFGTNFHMRAVTGAPYCGDQIDENTQTFGDGVHIVSHQGAIKECRDSQGRTRREEPAWRGPHQDGTNGPVLIHIDDPVANVRYILDPQNKVAHRHVLNNPDEGAPSMIGGDRSTTSFGRTPSRRTDGDRMSTSIIGPAPGTKSDAPHPVTTSENLGKETIEGVVANGHRTTMTYPVGSVGNDKEFTVTFEGWMSTELKRDVLTKRNDPRFGEQTSKLVNISTSEPDPALFQVPEGYTVSDDEDFRMEWRTPSPPPQ